MIYASGLPPSREVIFEIALFISLAEIRVRKKKY